MTRTSIATKNLVREKGRLAISIGGVAFAVVLMILLRALYVGILEQSTAYLRSVDAHLWVAQADTPENFFHPSTLLPTTVGAEIAKVDGVARVAPLVARPVMTHRSSSDFLLIGVDPSGVGGPPAIEEGRALPGPGEVVLDAVLADDQGVGVGDAIEVQGMSLRVAGIARGGNALMSRLAWAPMADVVGPAGSQEFVSYFLVDVIAGRLPHDVGQAISTTIPGLKAVTGSEFTDASIREIREGFLPILWIVTLLAFGIGAVVVGLTVYTATIEKKREYGLLKAIGFSNRRLAGIVWRQGVFAALSGLIVGCGLALVVANGLERIEPTFVTSVAIADVALIGLATVAMGCLSSLAPVRSIARLEPASIFRV